MSKNTRNRILLTAVAALLLVIMTVGGTLAYLTAQTTAITNTFEPTKIEIELTEPSGVTPNYKFDMVPGTTITKDAQVTVKANSEASYLFVVITESDNYSTFMEPYAVTSTWTLVEESTNKKVKVYYATAAATENEAATPVKILANDNVTVKKDIGATEFATLTADTYPTLKFEAYAVQQATLTYQQAWTALGIDITD